MKILYVSQYFPPEMGAPSARVSQLARHWSAGGHEVTVLTGFPNHPTGVVRSDYRSRFRRGFITELWEGIRVVRVWLVPRPNRRPIERVVNYTSFFLTAAIRGTFLSRPDVVIGTSPQLLTAVASWWIALIKRVPFVFEVRDIWPDGILASGVGREDSLFAKSLRGISRFLYRRADVIVIVSPAYADELVTKHGVSREKIVLVPNGVETEMFSPGSASEVDDEFELGSRFVVAFVGTVGLAHGAGTILEAARKLGEQDPEVLFLVVGEGSERAPLERGAAEAGLDNVRFAGEQPFERIPAILRRADAGLVLLKRSPTFETVIPTKMLECMAAGVPVVLGVRGQAQEILESADAGIVIEPEDAGELVQAVTTLRRDDELRARLGRNGTTYVRERFSRAETAAYYIDLLGRVTGG